LGSFVGTAIATRLVTALFTRFSSAYRAQPPQQRAMFDLYVMSTFNSLAVGGFALYKMIDRSHDYSRMYTLLLLVVSQRCVRALLVVWFGGGEGGVRQSHPGSDR
jgi:hypothetical protein